MTIVPNESSSVEHVNEARSSLSLDGDADVDDDNDIEHQRLPPVSPIDQLEKNRTSQTQEMIQGDKKRIQSISSLEASVDPSTSLPEALALNEVDVKAPQLSDPNEGKNDKCSLAGTSQSLEAKKAVSTSITTTVDTESARIGMENEFPKPFLCALTHKLLNDAVVAPDGKTYERQAILATKDYTENQLYPNRALQAIIEDSLETSGDSLDASIRRFHKSMRQGISQLLEKSPIPTDEYRPLPDAYYCPITFDLMHVPVIDPEGNTFEKVAIENWIRVNKSSPITRNYLTVDALYPNTAISDLLLFEKSKPEERMHPSVLKWKSEPPPVMPDIETPDEIAEQLRRRYGHLPTSLEELESRRASRPRLVFCTVLGIVCLILAISAAALYGGSCIFISIWVGCCVRDSLHRLRELREEEDNFNNLQAAQEARERQLRQEQYDRQEQSQQLSMQHELQQFQQHRLRQQQQQELHHVEWMG